MKLKKGDRLTIVGFEFDSDKHISMIVFETEQKNRIKLEASGEYDAYHYIGMSIIDQKKMEEEIEI